MDNNPVNEALPDAASAEDNEQNVEMPSHTDESLPALLNSAPATPKADNKTPKITVVLCPVGGAPIMRQRKWEVDSTQTIGFIASFIRKKLTLQKSDSLFFYVNQSFAPSLDQTVQNLFDCFGSDGKLILAYCRTQAWG
ncbi:autophagy protein 12-like [Daphnia pulicaria]|uniref:autophagy protein 12-like n=1 Tax=Daphnia pulicaria TaxID=35523 RepID=UPI001EEB5243|nr:autophagy protein 12-like [Daphnia pulicaria]XP_046647319.1 autophagy protein 12-like [Daphnia pulicaria]